jgi:Flp pilus assembly protein CpaB
MMFRFAYPAVLLLALAVAGWVVMALWRKPPSIVHPASSKESR